MIPYTPPEYNKSSFNCPHCKAYAKQIWNNFYYGSASMYNNPTLGQLKLCICTHCSDYSLWHNGVMIYPDSKDVESPNQDLDKEIIEDYEEAASIVQKSPRGAAALLRLAIQKLCKQLGEPGKNINSDIASLVKAGLPERIQKALDVVRVTGNEAVHPGVLDLKDDQETAQQLFRLINFIAEKMISEPKEVDKLFDNLPQTKKDEIKKRDENP